MNVLVSRTDARLPLDRMALVVVFIGFWAWMAGGRTIANETTPNVTELLRRYGESLMPYRQFKGEWKSVCSREIQQGPKGQYYQISLDGTKETRFSKIWRDNERERVMVIVDRGKGKESPIETVCLQNEKWLRLTQVAVSGRMKAVASDFADSPSLATPEMSFGAIFGEDIPAFVAPLSLSLHSEVKDGCRHYVISGKPSDRSFDIELWFDSTHSDALARIRYTSHSAYDPKAEHSERRLSFDWSVSRFQKNSGVFVPAEVTWRQFVPSYQTEGPPGKGPITLPPMVDVIRSSLVSIEFSPKFSAADLEPSIVVANGTPVYMLDAPHLQFEWQDGKIVPGGAEAMKKLRASRFLGGPGSPRFWLTVSGLIVVGFIGLFAIMRWRKARAGMV